MIAYIIRRLLLVIPTLFGIILLNFAIIQFAPGGPVELMIAQIQGTAVDATARITGADSGQESGAERTAALGRDEGNSKYRGARGLDPKLIAELEAQFGLDKPWDERFAIMVTNYVRFDFGKSFYSDRRVVDLVISKLPVSISIGLWTTLIAYLVSIPLGVTKAVRDGSRFDVATSTAMIVGYAIPGFLFAVLLIVVFAGGSYLQWFPLRGLVSDNWRDLSFPALVADYFWHMALPLIAMTVGAFAGLTMLTKNSFIEEIRKQYVTTARAKGVSERRVLYGHVFRNAMLIVIAGFPGAFIGIIFAGSFLIEVIFSLDGLGLLGFEAAINRDYPIIFGTLYFFSLIGLVFGIIGDLMYVVTDPRIDFERRST